MKKSTRLTAMLLCLVMMLTVLCSVCSVCAGAADVEVTEAETEAEVDADVEFDVGALPGMDYAIALIQNLLHRIISICSTVFDFIPILDWIS